MFIHHLKCLLNPSIFNFNPQKLVENNCTQIQIILLFSAVLWNRKHFLRVAHQTPKSTCSLVISARAVEQFLKNTHLFGKPAIPSTN